MRSALVVLLVAALGALAFTTLAPAKEGARARLTAKLPLSAAPGTTVRVAWAVDVADGQGIRRPFNAIGMFVRLLSRTGAPATIGFAAETGHPDRRYVAAVKVPPGGIRTGLRGTTDVFFPLANDPFTSPGSVRCDVAAMRATLAAFVSAYNGGEEKQLDALFSRQRFVWYSAGEPGARLREEAANRGTLLAYFGRRHVHGDRLSALALPPQRLRHQAQAQALRAHRRKARRRLPRRRLVRAAGQGRARLPKAPVTIAVMSLGGPVR